MQKNKAGFSYVEVLAAGTLFVIILLGVLPLTLGARQNLAFAQENLRLSLAANSLSLAVRDLVLGGVAVTATSIENLALGLGVENYSVYIIGSYGDGLNSFFHSSEDGYRPSLSGLESLSRGRGSRFVYVVVYNQYLAPAGRAINVVIDFDHQAGIWRNAGG